MSRPKVTCLHCKKEFTSLEKHKVCRKRDEALSASNLLNDSKANDDTSADGKDQEKAPQKSKCEYCRKEFTSLEKHKVCRKRDEALSISKGAASNLLDDSNANDDTSADGNDQEKPPQKSKCEYCKKEFTSLKKHKVCRKRDEALSISKGAASNLLDDSKANNDTSADGKDQEKAPQKSKCEYCKKEFTSLEKHKVCRKRDAALSISKGAASNLLNDSKANDDTSADGKDQEKAPQKSKCEYCRKEFTSLEKHKVCRKRDEALSISKGAASNLLDDSNANDDTSADGNDQEKPPQKSKCEYCKKEFTSLKKHKVCRKRDEALSISKGAASNLLDHSKANDDTSADGSDQEKAPQKSKCEHCKKEFTSLEKHKVCRKLDEALSISEGAASNLLLDSEVKMGVSRRTDEKSVVCPKGELYSKKVHTKTETCEDSPKTYLGGVSSNILTDQDIRELDKFVDILFRDDIVEKSGNPKSEVLNFFGSEVRLRKHEISEAAGYFGPLVRNVCKHLKETTGWEWKQLTSGSYYDGTKVSRPDEMDCMFVPQLKGLEVCTSDAPPGFCFVKCKHPTPKDDLKPFCEDGYLSSSKFRNHVFQCLDKFEKRRAKRDTTLSDGSPSYCLINDVGVIGGSHLNISMDLVPALHFPGWPDTARDLSKVVPDGKRQTIAGQGFHVVAKDYTGDSKVSHLLWRLSFSAAEKILTMSADSKDTVKGKDSVTKSPTTCRKPVLRILKRVLEIIKDKQDDCTREDAAGKDVVTALRRAASHVRKRGFGVEEHKFTTFQLRTLMWNEFYVTTLGDHVWGMDHRLPRLSKTMKQLKRMLTGQLPMKHFFIPGLDIMADVPRGERQYLYIMICLAEEMLL